MKLQQFQWLYERGVGEMTSSAILWTKVPLSLTDNDCCSTLANCDTNIQLYCPGFNNAHSSLSSLI